MPDDLADEEQAPEDGCDAVLEDDEVTADADLPPVLP